MKRIVFTLLFSIHSLFVLSQNLNGGNVIYKVEKTDEESASVASLIDNLDIALKQLEYNLRFNKEKSLYSIIKSVSAENNKLIKPAKIIAGQGNFYHEYGKEFLLQRHFLGELFLIKYDYGHIEWNISNVREKRGDFECIKAIGKRKNTDNENNKGIVAWFSNDISYQIGPKDYYGLPGLIVEVQENGIRWFAASVKLENEVIISKPLKGIEITKSELNKIAEKKAREQFRLGKNKN